MLLTSAFWLWAASIVERAFACELWGDIIMVRCIGLECFIAKLLQGVKMNLSIFNIVLKCYKLSVKSSE